MKFGGSSLANSDFINNVADIITGRRKKFKDIVIIVSAQGNTTDDLINKCKDITSTPSKRELDMLLSSGEQVSGALLAISLQSRGYDAISLLGWQAGIHTNLWHGNAKIIKIDTKRIRFELDSNKLVIVAGFQGLNDKQDITTLGRGGSDTTAVALAAILNAKLCEIYTDVDGIFTADPRIVKDAKLMSRISYEEMMEFANLGANVLHNRSVYIAAKYKVPLVIRSSFSNNSGTFCGDIDSMIDSMIVDNKEIDENNMTYKNDVIIEKIESYVHDVREVNAEDVKVIEEMNVSGIALDKNVATITISCLKDDKNIQIKIVYELAKNGINIENICQQTGDELLSGIVLFTFLIKKDDLSLALTILRNLASDIKSNSLSYNDKVAKVSAIGYGIYNSPKIMLSICEVLQENAIDIYMFLGSNSKISIIINNKNSELAMRVLHEKLELY